MNPPLRILLIEDHVPTNEALTRLLGANDTIHPAHTAAQALELAKAQPLDLVIADIGLPDQTGWELVKEIRLLQPRIMAIALTGYDYVEDAHRFSAAGFDMHLRKPADMAKIKAAIKALFPDRASGTQTD